MRTTQQHIEYLEGQLAQVQEFIARDAARLAEAPGDFAFQLSLKSWEAERDSILRDLDLLRNAKVTR